MRSWIIISLGLYCAPCMGQTQILLHHEPQADILSSLGIVRMVSTQTSVSGDVRGSGQDRITETFFDSLGRIIIKKNEACNTCGTINRFDSLTGLIAYSRFEWPGGVRETYHKYDDQKRRVYTENCESQKQDCEINIFEYDEDNTIRTYKMVQKKHLKRDTMKHSIHFFNLYMVKKDEKELVQERFFSPEGQLEESRTYRDGKFQNASIYEYAPDGNPVRIWSFDGKTKNLSNEMEHNTKGQVITQKTYLLAPEIQTTSPAIPLMEQTNEYDENGLLIRTVTTRAIIEYRYFTE
jgi:hypothetical protein